MDVSSPRKSFTLVEMLIVIVIIGILAAALIPRITGTQARARDVARESDLRDLSNAVTMYSVDHDGRYPPAFNANATLPSKQLTASTGPMIYTPDRLLAAIPTGAEEGTVEVLGENLSTYISALPEDPTSDGIGAKSHTNKDCEEKGPSYAYYSNAAGDMYAITAKMEKAKGNTTNCGGLVDTRDGAYKAVGEGLVYSLSSSELSESLGFDPQSDDPVGWCMNIMTDEDVTNLNEAGEDMKNKQEWCATTEIDRSIVNLGTFQMPPAIWKIVGLKKLKIWRGRLTSNHINWPSENHYLEELNLGENRISSIDIPSTLPNLSILNLSDQGGNIYGRDKEVALQSITFPDRMEHIKRIDLKDNWLVSIDFPDIMDKLEGLNIANNRITEFHFDSDAPNLLSINLGHQPITSVTFGRQYPSMVGMSIMNANLTDLDIVEWEKIPNVRGVYQDNKFTNIVIPSTRDKIPHYAFYNNHAIIENVYVHDGVQSIEEAAFTHGSGLNSISIPFHTTYKNNNSYSRHQWSFPENCTEANGCIIRRDEDSNE